MTVDRIPVHRFTAISSLQPNARFTGGSDKVVQWRTPDIPQPTEEEIQAEITRLTNEYNAAKYQRDRASEYPSVVDQLDDIYHNGIDAWKATIKKTKDKYPKP